eukprot:gene25226-46215_t
MALGDHGDGHGAATGGRWSRGSRWRLCVRMPVFVAVIVPMVMSVVMPMPTVVVVPAAVPRRIGTAFGFKGQVLLGHDQVHGAQHVGQHVVGLDLEVVGLQFDRHMAVAQVVGGTGQIERRAVVLAVRDDQHRLWRRNHADHGAVFGHQHIAAAHQRAARQENAQFAP